MAQEPTGEEIGKWNRWFGVETNNLAWTLAERLDRTPADEETMLNAAHAAALHWGRIGTELERARADMLLGHVHALAGNGPLAMLHARRSHDFPTGCECPDWEVAFAHAILANAGRVAGEESLYTEQYALARQAGKAIRDREDKEIFQRTFSQMAALEAEG